MIVRVLTGKVGRDRRALFDEQAQQVAAAVGPASGLLPVSVGRQTHGDSEHVVVVTEWRELESLYRFVGPDLMAASLLDSRQRQPNPFEDFEVQHFEAPAWSADSDEVPSWEPATAPAEIPTPDQSPL